MKVISVCCGPPVNESEKVALRSIHDRLKSEPGDCEWMLLSNLPFSSSNRYQSDEIDMVVIGPPGVTVIEVKHWNADWIKRNPESVENAADLLTNKARRVGTNLRKKVSQLGKVEGTFLLTDTTTKTKNLADASVRGVPFYNLRTCLDAISFAGRPELSTEQIRYLGRCLSPAAAIKIDGTLKRLGEYSRLSLLSKKEQCYHRIYKATHSTRQDKVILHLYDLSVNESPKLSPDDEFKEMRRICQFPWAPPVIDSLQDAPRYTGEMAFFTVTDPAAPSIQNRAISRSWCEMSRQHFAFGAIRALQEFQELRSKEGLTVRININPKTVHANSDNAPIFSEFVLPSVADDFATSDRLGHLVENTVALEDQKKGFHSAIPQLELYALCKSLLSIFEDYDSESSHGIVRALHGGIQCDFAEQSTLEDIGISIAELIGEKLPSPPPPPSEHWSEDQIIQFRNHHYRIVSVLGSDQFESKFKVVEFNRKTGEDLGTYVAKVVREKSIGERILDSYKIARSHIGRQQALSTIYEVASDWERDSFVALATWIEGRSLDYYSGYIQILADELREENADSLVSKWLKSACEALDVFHRNGLIHGDIRPNNILVADSGIVITDYDCVGKIGTPNALESAGLFCSPNFRDGKPAEPSDDFFALAASIFCVLRDGMPFLSDEDQSNVQKLNWTGIDRSEYPTVASFFDRATNPDPKLRISTANEALAELNRFKEPKHITSLSGVLLKDGDELENSSMAVNPIDLPVRRNNEVKWLKDLLQAYPGSFLGNSETRGLDSDFAEKTYVETKLENTLFSEINERSARLVILCGNAGDGKTALLQHLAKRFQIRSRGSTDRILEGKLENGLTVRMNLDGSASWRGRSADKLLDDFLEPFKNGRPETDIAHLLAINDGKLLEWIENFESSDHQETQLTRDLSSCLNAQTLANNSHIRFINLNHRSLVGDISSDETMIKTEFLDQLLDSLYGGKNSREIWKPCRSCSAQSRCEIYSAMRVFGPGSLPDLAPKERRDRARQRLFELLQAVHLRGETHITVRELRAAIIYILFGIHYCHDYHEGVHPPPLPYPDQAFSKDSPNRQGETLREFVFLDPALESHPKIDRYLLQTDFVDSLNSVSENSGLDSARRRAYFELTEFEINNLTGEPDSLDLAHGRYIREFRDLPIKSESIDEICGRLCQGISRLELLPPQARKSQNVVPLRITPRTPTETSFWIEKKASDFLLKVDLPLSAGGLERLHRRVTLSYQYRDGRKEQLRLGAELFHLLLELNDGYQLDAISTDETFAQLSIFVQRLVREDERRILAWNPMTEDTVHEIVVENNRDPNQKPRQDIVFRNLSAG